MRVLVITVVHTPLDARIHRREVAALLDAGHDVVYAAPFSGHGVGADMVDPRLTAVDMPRAQQWRRCRSLLRARSLLRRFADEVDVVIMHDPELLLAAMGLTSRVPMIWDVHEDLSVSFADKPWVPPRLARVLGRGVRRMEAWAERVVTLTLAEEAYVSRFHSVHPVVPNLPPLPLAPRGPEDDRVVYVGRVSRLRGAHELARVGAALRAVGISLEVLGPIDRDVATEIKAAEHDGHLVAPGFVPNDVAMSRIDGALAGLSLLHDHPNYRHSMPTKVVEYQAAGVPVVTTPLPAAAAMVTASGSGQVVPFGDVDAAVKTVRDLAEDRARAREMGAAGRAAAESGLSWDAVAPAFVEVVERAASRGHRPRTSRRPR